MATKDKESFLKDKISKLSLEEKIGATLTMHCLGSVYLPVMEDIITNYHIGGLRLVPSQRYKDSYLDCEGKKGIYMVPEENEFLKKFSIENLRYLYKRYQDLAMQRNGSIPLHMAFDCEGEYSGDFKNGGGPVFPPPMGITASGDPKLAYGVAHALSRIARSICGNMIHSPCLDVNVNPKNPEINTRSYSDIPEKVAEYAIESCKGFKDGGLIAFAKHFPGRGNSDVDAHHVIPVIPVDYDTFWNVDLYPYRALIEQDLLPGIMTAHTIYPAVDPDNVATLSPKILKDLVRDKMGFKGVITSDAIGMNGITLNYSVAEGTARALEAGVDMVLLRMSNPTPIVPMLPEVISTIRDFVEAGRITEEDLDAKVYRILESKYNIGLFEEDGTSWKEDVTDVIKDPEVIEVYNQVSSKNVFIVKNEEEAIPLPKDSNALVIEQTFNPFLCSNDDFWAPGILYNTMQNYSQNISYFEMSVERNEEREKLLLEQVDKFDTIVISNWTRRSSGSINYLIKAILEKFDGKLIVIANTPYEEFSLPKEVKNAIVHFGMVPKSVETAVEVLFGDKDSTGVWPIAYRP